MIDKKYYIQYKFILQKYFSIGLLFLIVTMFSNYRFKFHILISMLFLFCFLFLRKYYFQILYSIEFKDKMVNVEIYSRLKLKRYEIPLKDCKTILEKKIGARGITLLEFGIWNQDFKCKIIVPNDGWSVESINEIHNRISPAAPSESREP